MSARMLAKDVHEDKSRDGKAKRMRNFLVLFVWGVMVGMVAGDAQAAPSFSLRQLQKKCKRGDGISCWSWVEQAEKLPNDRRGRSFLQRAAKMWKRGFFLLKGACARGEGKACWYIGGVYYEGRHLKRSMKRSLSFMIKSCQARFVEACDFAGVMYGGGMGTTRDLRMARRMHQKACSMGSMDGCTHLGGLFLRGLGGSKNLYEARQLFRRACTKGNHGHACTLLAEMQIRGEGGSQRVKGAMKTYRKACRLGAKVGCDRYQEMLKIFRPTKKPVRSPFAPPE